jgi:hypothetical protein
MWNLPPNLELLQNPEIDLTDIKFISVITNYIIILFIFKSARYLHKRLTTIQTAYL